MPAPAYLTSWKDARLTLVLRLQQREVVGCIRIIGFAVFAISFLSVCSRSGLSIHTTELIEVLATIDLSMAPLVRFGEGRLTNASPEFSFQNHDQLALTYQCALDNGPLQPCTSPFNPTGLTTGNHEFIIAVQDSDKNQEIGHFPFLADADAPIGTVRVFSDGSELTGNPLALANPEAELKITTSDSTSAVSEMQICRDNEPCEWQPVRESYPITLASESSVTYTIRFRDLVGNESTSFNIDLAYHAIVWNGLINNGARYTISPSVLVTFGSNDLGGKFKLCNPGTRNCSLWLSGTAPAPWMIDTGTEGTRDVEIWFKDSSGKTSASPRLATIYYKTLSSLSTQSLEMGKPVMYATSFLSGGVFRSDSSGTSEIFRDPAHNFLGIAVRQDPAFALFLTDPLDSELFRISDTMFSIPLETDCGSVRGLAGIARSSDGTLYTADSGNHRILKIWKSGNFWRCSALELIARATPIDVTLNASESALYITDIDGLNLNSSRIHRVDLNSFSVRTTDIPVGLLTDILEPIIELDGGTQLRLRQSDTNDVTTITLN